MEAIEAVLSVVEFGSLSAAARELGVSHAALSRRVALAESWAGVRLFERHGRGMRLTVDGQRIAGRAQTALEQLASLRHIRVPPPALPAVRLAVTPSFARWWLLPRLRELEGQPHDLRIEVMADIGVVSLPAGDADIAIRFGRGNWRDLVGLELFKSSIVPVGRRLPSLTSSPAQAKAIAREPLLHAADSTLWRAWHSALRLPYKGKAADRTFSDYAMTLDAAKAGLGVALWIPAFHERPVELEAASRLACQSPLTYHLLTRRGETNPAVVLLVRRLSAMACRTAGR
jgi:DNA-binding transcriptional LysR family regulator